MTPEVINIDFRVSSLPDYNDCTRKTAMAFLNDTEKFDLGIAARKTKNNGIASVMGTAVHSAITKLLIKKRAHGDFTQHDVDNHLEGAQVDVTRAFADIRPEDMERFVDKISSREGNALIQVEAMVRAAVPVLRQIKPLRIEKSYSVVVSPLGESAIPIQLTAHPDLLDEDGVVWDHKSGGQIPAAQAQLGGYILVCKMSGENAHTAKINYIKRPGVKSLSGLTAKVVQMDGQICLDLAWQTLKQIQIDYEAWLKSGRKDHDIFRPNPKTRLCTPNWCSAYKTDFCRVGGCMDAVVEEGGEFD